MKNKVVINIFLILLFIALFILLIIINNSESYKIWYESLSMSSMYIWRIVNIVLAVAYILISSKTIFNCIEIIDEYNTKMLIISYKIKELDNIMIMDKINNYLEEKNYNIVKKKYNNKLNIYEKKNIYSTRNVVMISYIDRKDNNLIRVFNMRKMSKYNRCNIRIYNIEISDYEKNKFLSFNYPGFPIRLGGNYIYIPKYSNVIIDSTKKEVYFSILCKSYYNNIWLDEKKIRKIAKDFNLDYIEKKEIDMSNF